MVIFRRLGLALPAQQRIFAAFFVYSFGFGGFFARLAEIQHAMGVAEGALGLALIGVAAGTLVSLTFANRWIARLGQRHTLAALLPMVPLLVALASFAPSPLTMFLCLFPLGLAVGAIELVVNLEADRVEHQTGRHLMNRAHAFWSFGFFGAALLGSLFSWLGLSPQLHLALVVPIAWLAMLLILGRFEAAPARPGDVDSGAKAVHVAVPTRYILVLLLVASPALLMEGASIDWGAIYMRNVFATAPAIGALAVAVAVLAQALSRFWIDHFVARFGPVKVARVLLLVLGVGALLVFFAQLPAVALAGFGLMGVGGSAIFPMAMSAAAQRTDRPAAENVAALTQTVFVEFLLAPPLLGQVAEHVGVRWCYGIGLPMVLIGLWLVRSLGPEPRAEFKPA